ncbi:MAG: ABC transporter ATP-binding protein [Bacillota bacterium]|nr:ABC transporter ATP-binding protein [Bacillota bacterium]
MDDLVKLMDVEKHFPIWEGFLSRRHRYVRAVDRISLSIARGETFGLVGESGSGKTTLARLIPRLTKITAGKLLYSGTDVAGAPGAQMMSLRRRMGIVFQDPSSSLNPRVTVKASIQRPLELASRPRPEIERRTLETAELVNLGRELLDRYPHQLSGGQQQRASIARAVILRPEFLILDEPTSSLDVSVQAQILNLLLDLQQEFGLTYLLITHNLTVVRYMCDRVGVMYLGKLAELSPVADLYRNPLHPYSVALLSASPPASPRSRNRERVRLAGDPPSLINPPAGCRLNPRCPYAFDRCRVEEPKLMERAPKHFVACHRVS